MAIVVAALALSFGTGRALAQRAMGMDSDFHCCSVNFKTAAANGIQFACIKATELDTGFSNSVFASRMTAAQAAGVYTIPYNRCNPSLYQPRTEAQFFWSWASTNIGAGGYNLSPALDIENGLTGNYRDDNGAAISLAGWCNQWFNDVSNYAATAGIHLQQLTYVNVGVTCALGSGLRGYLWLADPCCSNNPAGDPYTCGGCGVSRAWDGCLPTGSRDWAIYQYAWYQLIPGPTEHVDLNVANGTLAQLIATLGTTTLKPAFVQPPPASVTVNAGGTLLIPALATGTTPLGYQWADVSGGANVAAGSTNSLPLDATLTVSGVPAGWNNHTLRLTVTNAYGSTNLSVTLSVISGFSAGLPSPTNLTLYAGQSFTYTAQTAGTLPFYYRWYAGTNTSTPIPNATNASYTAVATPGRASYLCQVSNSFNGLSVTNLQAALTGIAPPAHIYPLTVLSNNPIAYWRLDEVNGDIAYDYVGGHSAALNQVQAGVPGYNPAEDSDFAALFGTNSLTHTSYASNSYALELDQSGNGVPNIDFATTGNAQFSVEAWVNLSPQSPGGGIITKGYGHAEQFDLDLGAPNTDYRFFVRNYSGASSYVCNSANHPDGNWHHLVGVCDEAQTSAWLYVDAVVAAKATIPVGAGLHEPAEGTAGLGDNRISIGARLSGQTSTGFDLQTRGTVDEVALYNYALSSNQVAAHYLAGLPVTPGVLTISNLSNGQVQLIWNFSGTLESATNVAGPYGSAAQVSPYTVPATNAGMFYRVRQR